MEMIGDRELLHQLFNRYDGSMSWSSSPGFSLSTKIRWKRFELYQAIKKVKATGKYFPDVLANAERHLQETVFPAMLGEAKGKMELAYLNEGLEFAHTALITC